MDIKSECDQENEAPGKPADAQLSPKGIDRVQGKVENDANTSEAKALAKEAKLKEQAKEQKLQEIATAMKRGQITDAQTLIEEAKKIDKANTEERLKQIQKEIDAGSPDDDGERKLADPNPPKEHRPAPAGSEKAMNERTEKGPEEKDREFYPHKPSAEGKG